MKMIWIILGLIISILLLTNDILGWVFERRKGAKIRIIIWLAALCMLVVVDLFMWVFVRRIDPNEVDRVEIFAYDHSAYGDADLTEKVMRKAIGLCNVSLRVGDVNAEPCCAGYGLWIYLKDGRRIEISEGVRNKLILHSNDYHGYIASKRLRAFILEVAAQYELPLP